MIFIYAGSWDNVRKRKSFFENYAKANGFDPLVANHWYGEPADKILATKVFVSCQFIKKKN